MTDLPNILTVKNEKNGQTLVAVIDDSMDNEKKSESLEKQQIDDRKEKIIEVKTNTEEVLACTCWRSQDSAGRPSGRVAGKGHTACDSPNCIYSYIHSTQSFEQFKIQIHNMNKYASNAGIKKLLKSLQLEYTKLKLVHKGPCYVNFRSSEDCNAAIAKLHGYVYKGQALNARVCNPAADPLLLKRAQEGHVDFRDIPPKRSRQDETPKSLENIKPIDLVAPLWNIPYDPDQLKQKQQTALDCLKKLRLSVQKINKFKYCDTCLESGFYSSKYWPISEECCPITPSPVQSGYRNKCEFTIGNDSNGKGPVIGCRLGKYRDGSTAVGIPSDIPIFSLTALAVVKSLQQFFDVLHHSDSHPGLTLPVQDGEARLADLSSKLKIYDLVHRKGHWSLVMIRETRQDDRLLFVELHRDDLTLEEEKDVEFLLHQWFAPGGSGESAHVTALFISILFGISHRPGEYKEICVFGNDIITETCCSLKFSITKDAFFQVNTLAAEKLYNEIKSRCMKILSLPSDPKTPFECKKGTVLLDICCGTGTIGLCLAKYFEKVIGIEIVPSAVENAKQNAELNSITNARFLAGRAEELVKDAIRNLPKDVEIIAVLDPPRAGVHGTVIDAIRMCSRIKHVIYVACDLAAAIPNFVSFARPPSKRHGGDTFLPTCASCVDLFPQTPGIEVIVSLKRFEANNCVHPKE